ncbi:MAG: DUF1566 domain-containing protein [Gammaproteobacteria bacterium]
MKKIVLIASLTLATALPANAELFDRGAGLIYDSVLDVTWLQNAQLGQPSSNWAGQMSWAENLSFGDYDDWRLPSMDVNGDDTVVDCTLVSEAMCQDNELGYMHEHNLGGGSPLTGDQGPFLGIEGFYWSSTQFAASPDNLAWNFFFTNGGQSPALKINNAYGWAVRDGDSVSLDSDGDGVSDNADNCTLVANADQRDSNNDGFGNICDPDLDNNGVVNFLDVSSWVPFFNTSCGDVDQDFNGEGNCNFADYSVLIEYFNLPPGPSGLVP